MTPSPEEMLQALVDANREAYERRNAEPVTNPANFDLAYRRRKLADEEAKPGSIQRAWENLTGNAPRRVQPAAKETISQLDYTGGLAATLIADSTWTTEQIIQMLVDADGISHELAARIHAESIPEGCAERVRREERRELREKEAAGSRPAVPHLERLTVPPPTPPVAEPDHDLDDADLWTQEPA